MTLPMCVASNDHYWHGGSICTACGVRLRCGCGRFIREDDLDRHFMSGECSTVPGPAPCWPGECDATCSVCLAANIGDAGAPSVTQERSGKPLSDLGWKVVPA